MAVKKEDKEVNKVNKTKKIKKIYLILIFLSVVCYGINGKEAEIKKCTAPPVIDGKLDDECWRKSAKLELVSNVMGEELFEKTYCYVTYDDNNLYVLAECNESLMDEIKATAKSPDEVWADDCVEIFIDPTTDEVSYFHILINSAGLTAKNYNKQEGVNATWKVQLSVKTFKDKNKWLVEVAIPIYSLSEKKEVSKDSWNINIERERPPKSNSPYEDSIWSPTWGSSHMPDKFGKVRFK